MQALDKFKYVVRHAHDYARQWKETHGRPVIGTFCSYAPEEIILAAGALGFRILGSGGPVERADAHLQAYSCSLARTALEDALAGNLNFLDGTVFPHTCDTIQRLSDIWRLNAGFALHADVVLPVQVHTAAARTYAAEVLKRFRRDLEAGLGRPIRERDLAAAIETYNRLRESLRRLYALRRRNPGAIDGWDVATVVRASMVMDRDMFAADIRDLLEVLEPTPEPIPPPKRLFLSGGVCSLPDIFTAVEDAGAVVVDDDLCTGGRHFSGIIDTQGDLVANIAGRYLERVICPAKHAGLESRGQELLAAVRASRAQGVIFLCLKFCDPHLFDYPHLKQMLAAEGIPVMLYELEENARGAAQFATRCQAFVEMLQEGT